MWSRNSSARVAVAVIGLAALVSFAGLVSGCERVMVFASADAGRTIDVDTGETFDIELASNPSTGYSWQVEALDESIVEQVGDPAFAAEAQKEEIVGAGGVETFTFEAVSAGECEITLVYVRPWEWESTQPVAPEAEYTFTVSVK